MGKRGPHVLIGATKKGSKTLGLRLTFDEYDELKARAQAVGQSQADFARRVILPAIGRRHPLEVLEDGR